MASSYDLSLVILSIVISVLASFTALRLAQRVGKSHSAAQYAWLTAAAAAMGGGIWAMHFVAMLAFSLAVPITYSLDLTLLSLALAIAFTAAGILLAFHFGTGGKVLCLAGILMGSGIATMHYTGMAAMQMGATIHYDLPLVGLSVIIAIVASMAALWLTFRFQTVPGNIIAALIMGTAVCGMHYCGMYAASFTQCQPMPENHSIDLPLQWLAIGVAAITIIVLCLGLVLSIVDQRLSARVTAEANRLRGSEARFRSLAQNAADAVTLTDRQGKITYESPSTESVLGYTPGHLIGETIHGLVDPPDRASFYALLHAVAERPGITRSIDVQLRQGNGHTGQFEIIATNLLDDENVGGIVLNIRDVSARLQNLKLEDLVIQRTRELSAANQQLLAEIAERNAAEQALQQAHDQLERKVLERTAELESIKNAAIQASRAKSQFLANMSHELRTPLNAIIGFADALSQGIRGPLADRQAEYINDIIWAGRHLLHLINDILDLSKIESGKIQLDYRDCILDSFTSEIAMTIRPVVEQNGNRFTVDCAANLGSVLIDQVKARQALLNLLGNAAKFTKNGDVELSVQRLTDHHGDRIQFIVRDTGIGIAPEALSHLFENFYQANPGITREFGGTGLGLALSQKLCHAMGGDIYVESKLGIGSTFIIDLPAAP
jgi:PAS domain S-box-containing protein